MSIQSLHWPLAALLLLTGCQSAKMRVASVTPPPAKLTARAAPPPPPAVDKDEEDERKEEEARERAFSEEFAKHRLSDEEVETSIRGARKFDRGLERADAAAFASTNAPSNWKPIGPAPMFMPAPSRQGSVAGFVGAVAVHPTNPSVILAGTVSGIWRSADGGEKFVPVSRKLEYRDCRAIAFAPSDPRYAYAGCSNNDADAHAITGFGGFMRSDDGGGTWTKPSGRESLPAGYPNGNTKKILVHPNVPTLVYAAVAIDRFADRGNGGLYQSIDGGITWARIFAGGVTDIEFHPSNPAIIYLAAKSTPASSQVNVTGSGAGFYRSSNSGGTFTRVAQAAGSVSLELAVTPAAANDVYMFNSFPNPAGVLQGQITQVTFNAAGTPTSRVSNLPANSFASFFQIDFDPFYEIDPADARTQYFGAFSVYKSTDSGATWRDIGTNVVHVDQHALAFLGSSRSFVVGNDGGIWKSTDAGATFSSLNKTLQVMDMVGFGVHPTDASVNCSGLFHNGFGVRGDEEWNSIGGGDGGACTFDPANPGRLLIALMGDRTVGVHEFPVDSVKGLNQFPDTKRIASIQPLTHDGVGPRIYFADFRVWYSEDGGLTYQRTPSGDLDLTRGGTDRITALGLTRADQKLIMAGSQNGRLMLSRDGGATWTDRTAGLARALGVTAANATRQISSIVMDPTYPDTAVIGLGGTGGAHVLRSNDFGASWSDLTGAGASNYGAPLPDTPVNAVTLDPLDNAVIYAATDMGLYRYVYGSTNWTSFGRGLPKWVATGAQAFATQHASQGGLIQLGTRGAGVFQLERQKPCESAGVLSRAGVSEELSDDDCVSPIQPSLARARRYQVTVKSGTAVFRVRSKDFDPYIYAIATGGLALVLGENDDEDGSTTAARIQLGPGSYVFEVTSNDVHARGGFIIEVLGDAVLEE